MKYIIIDGQDKTGKTSVAKKLQKDFDAKVVRFPSKKSLFEEVLSGNVKNQLVSLHLFSADILGKIEALEKEGGKYIFDRSFISTMAYQSQDIADRYFDGNLLKAFDYVFGSYFPDYKIRPEPEFIFILTVSKEEYMNRLMEWARKTNKNNLEVFERVEFQEELIDKFVKIYKYLSFWFDDKRIMLIDTSNKSINEVYEVIKGVLESINF